MTLGLSDLYRKSVADFNLYSSRVVRSFIEYSLNQIEATLKSELGNLIIVRAPPGIGKTAVPVTILLSTLQGHVTQISSVIHVAPTRSLIDDLAIRLKSSLSKLLGEKLAEELVARQHGLSHETSGLVAPYTITTFDTYLYNFFKLPTDEIVKIYHGNYGHYEVPRATILSSLNFFDETHMVVEESSKMSLALIASIRALIAFKVPSVISTATLSNSLLKRIVDLVGGRVKVIDYESYVRENGVDEFYQTESSKEFKAIRNRPLINVQNPCLIDEGEFLGHIEELLYASESGLRACIVVNTIVAAQCMFSKLKHRGNVILIHSRFTPEDRMAKLEALRKTKGVLLITTQVLEVGIDTNFDMMLSQVAPPSSLVQRFGRLARGESASIGVWAVFASNDDLMKGSHVYLPVAVNHSWNVLREIADVGDKINWHLPNSVKGDFRGYSSLLEDAWLQNTFSVPPSFYKILTSPLIDSSSVLEFLRVIGGFRDENICSLYPIDEDVLATRDFDFGTLWLKSVPVPCDYMLEYAGRLIVNRYPVSLLERKAEDDISVKPLSPELLERLKRELKKDPFSFSFKYLGIRIPASLYEGGVHGVGVKDV